MKQDLRDGVVTLIAVTLLAGPVALIWSAITPRTGYASSSNYTLAPVDLDNFVQADGRFFILTLSVGAVCGVGAWLIGRNRGLGVPVGLAAGSLLASFAVARIGELRMRTHVLHELDAARLAPGEHFLFHYPPFAHSALFVWGFAAVLVFVGLVVVRSDR